jgi:hypothetical protein
MTDNGASPADLTLGMDKRLNNYAALRPRDVCVVAYSPDSRRYAAQLRAVLNARGVTNSFVAMRPFHDPVFRENLDAVLPNIDDVPAKLIVISIEREALSHGNVFEDLFGRYPASRIKVIRIISASDELFQYGLDTTPAELSQRNAALLEMAWGEERIRVTTAAGTDLEIEFDHDRYQWISNRGTWRPGAFSILPAGEVATYPVSVNGRLVADGAARVNVVNTLDSRLADEPITVDIVDSIAAGVECRDAEMRELIMGCFERDNVRRVGEVGLGTNVGCTSFAPMNSHLNERVPGLHLGFGTPNQPTELVGYDAIIHLDLVTRDAEVTFPKAGRSVVLSTFVPPPGILHPSLVRDQDVSGDCCSRGCNPMLPGILVV